MVYHPQYPGCYAENSAQMGLQIPPHVLQERHSTQWICCVVVCGFSWALSPSFLSFERDIPLHMKDLQLWKSSAAKGETQLVLQCLSRLIDWGGFAFTTFVERLFGEERHS